MRWMRIPVSNDDFVSVNLKSCSLSCELFEVDRLSCFLYTSGVLNRLPERGDNVRNLRTREEIQTRGGGGNFCY